LAHFEPSLKLGDKWIRSSLQTRDQKFSLGQTK
jgi:hypothetical protein